MNERISKAPYKMRMPAFCCELAIILLISFQVEAFPIADTVDSTSYEHQLKAGVDAFYSGDWNKAEAVFNRLQKKYSKDSRAYFFEAIIPFWEYYFGGQSQQTAQIFFDRSETAIRISKSALSENSSDTTMILMLSGLYGYRSLVAAGEKEYKDALQSGLTGFKYTRQLLSLDSDDPRALIGKGIFYYMIGSVPRGLKWATNLAGMTADIQKGFEALEEAAQSENYVRNDAKMILAYLYEREGEMWKALMHLDELVSRYPKNIIFQYNRARILELNNQPTEARKQYELVTNMKTRSFELLKQKSQSRLQKL